MRRLGITEIILPKIVLALESTLDVIEAHNSVKNVIEAIQLVKKEVDDSHDGRDSAALEVAAKVKVVLTMPRIAATARHHANIPAENEESYFKRNLTISH